MASIIALGRRGALSQVIQSASLSRPFSEFSRLKQLRQKLKDEREIVSSFLQPSGSCDTRQTGVISAGQPQDASKQPLHLQAFQQLQGARLADSFGRQHSYLRISLTERCNLRCTYCMPSDDHEPRAPAGTYLSSQEVLRLASLFVSHGVNKIRLTGGEPTLRKDLVELCGQLNKLPGLETLALTTNGVLLKPLLPALVSNGLTHLNISLDTLQRSKLPRISGRSEAHWDRTWAAIQTALQMTAEFAQQEESPAAAAAAAAHASASATPLTVSGGSHKRTGLRKLKLNCVVMRSSNLEELPALAALTLQHPHLEVRFIELMPFHGNSWDSKECVGYAEMLQRLKDAFPHLAPVSERVVGPQQLQDLHNAGSETAKLFLLEPASAAGQLTSSSAIQPAPSRNGSGSDRGSGQVGFITTMTDAFCSSCNRLRLTVDGSIKACLHGAQEIQLRDAMRAGASDPQLLGLIQTALQGKHARLGGHESVEALLQASNAPEARPMIRIGG